MLSCSYRDLAILGKREGNDHQFEFGWHGSAHASDVL